MNLGILGLIFDIMGVLIVTLTEIVNPRYGKIHNQSLKKTYWWNGWRPFYKNTQTLKWKMKLNRKPIVYGIIPPKYKLEFFGLILILVGFILQILFYLSN